ncbi:hypothetical protein TWF696_004621 [Orbilia brochopaga]|uniref:Uncharacterized protein n=1 Tax=Orbilia brochopaga TaxID=3140254 RepID=A0AAV9V6N4_9PEZI
MSTIVIQQFENLDIEAAAPHKPAILDTYELSADRPAYSPPQFPFLRLPRELRDEVYTYLVCFKDTTPTVPGIVQPSQPDYQPIPRLNLSIFRVSKQVHEEASRVFYTRNVFPVRILTESRVVADKTYFDVWYDTPWESMIYSAAENTIGTYCGTIWSAGSYIHESKLPVTPSPRYRPLLRHVRVDVVDVRIDANRRKVEPLSEIARSKVRKLLLPFTYRLQDMLSAAGAAAQVDINVFSALVVDGPDKWRAADGNLNSELPTEPVSTTRSNLTSDIERNATDAPTTSIHMDLYEELLSTISPLTTGPYRHTLSLPRPLAAQFGQVTPAILRDCKEKAAAELTASERHLYKDMRISTACFWVILKGRVHAVDAHEDDCFGALAILARRGKQGWFPGW